MILVIM